MLTLHPVAQVLYRRRDEGSSPGSRTDSYRVGLAVEGGGMRGIVSGAMMAALLDRKLIYSFDAVYAFSAGAINSAYFLAQMGWYALSIYYDDLISRAFLDLFRILKRRSIMSLDYVMDEVLETIKPLNYEAILASTVELHIVASSIQDLKPRVFTHFVSKRELKEALKASICLPIAAGAPMDSEGDLLLDGGVLLAHPVLTALEDDCTHVLVIRTRTDSPLHPTSLAGRRLMVAYLQHLRLGLGTAYIDTLKQYEYLQRHLQEVSRRREGPPFILDVACSDGAHQVTRFSQNRGILLQGLRAGYSSMIQALDGLSGQVYLRPELFVRM